MQACYNGDMPARPHIALNAHLLSGESSYRSAGIHAYIYNTLIRLPAAGPDLDYTAFVGTGQLPDAARLLARRSRLPTHNPVIRIVWEQAIAPFELARLKPSLLHGMAFTTPLLWPGKTVVTVFDMSFARYPERLSASRRGYLSLFTRLSARRASRVIAISESGKAEIETLLGIEGWRIAVAVPGVSADFCPALPADVEDFRLRQGLPQRFILYVGTLEPRKNLETLIRAYARLPQRGKVKLALVGATGWQAEPVFRLIEDLEMGEDIIIAGYASPTALPLWYSAAEMFVYPSLYEGFGLPVLEALACGAPVIASNATSLPEVVGPEGILVEPMDVDAWCDAMASLLDDPTRRADLSARGPVRAATFRWDRTAEQTVAAYRAALSDTDH
jgi:glycosyltransferase involved in cell wall biosynthesis